jgi:hypothetical protein
MDAEREKRTREFSNLEALVPPLRGFLLRVNTVPPLPRWATLFRPWRDWLAEA